MELRKLGAFCTPNKFPSVTVYSLLQYVLIGNWQSVSEDAKSLVRQMLELDPARRITTAQVH